MPKKNLLFSPGLGKKTQQVVAKYLWSHVTPWLQADVDFIAAAPPSDVFESSPFLGLHVRRGDKISMGEAHFHPCEVGRLPHSWPFFQSTSMAVPAETAERSVGVGMGINLWALLWFSVVAPK